MILMEHGSHISLLFPRKSVVGLRTSLFEISPRCSSPNSIYTIPSTSSLPYQYYGYFLMDGLGGLAPPERHHLNVSPTTEPSGPSHVQPLDAPMTEASTLPQTQQTFPPQPGYGSNHTLPECFHWTCMVGRLLLTWHPLRGR